MPFPNNPSDAVPGLGQLLQGQTLQTEASRSATAASLAGGMIAATNRAWSLKEAMELYAHVRFAIFPSPGHGNFEAWRADANRFDRKYE